MHTRMLCGVRPFHAILTKKTSLLILSSNVLLRLLLPLREAPQGITSRRAVVTLLTPSMADFSSFFCSSDGVQLLYNGGGKNSYRVPAVL